MNHQSADYTFWGLFNFGTPFRTPITTLAYLVGLIESPTNQAADLKKAKFILRYLFDVEEQVKSASELRSVQEETFPKGFYPQTPVMLTIQWSPIAELLNKGCTPILLEREMKQMACALGIWEWQSIKELVMQESLNTSEELFWYIIRRVLAKAENRKLSIIIISMPGWSYEDNRDRPYNLTLEAAQKADRVIWQRTPRVKRI
jgi:hypothetical protein